jgi:phosphoribosylamine--glycine ligase
VPTSAGQVFDSMPGAVAFLDELGPPYVVKADGLAAGKGVVVTNDREHAIAAVEQRVVDRVFGDQGSRVVIEEYLEGPEVSLIAFCDGSEVVACEPAQDYKRIADGDRGPNTGGMGSYSPVPVCPPALVDQMSEEIIRPVVAATGRAGAPFIGALYAGLALTTEGPKVVEFNVRFGDPETQALIPRLRSDFGELCAASAVGELAGMKAEWKAEACVAVVLASQGYPAEHDVGLPISGIDKAEAMPDVSIFQAGTERRNGDLVTAGGRVLAVSALGPTFVAARRRAYDAAAVIEFEGKHLRTDIGLRAVEEQ